MSTRKKHPAQLNDIEKPHLLAVEPKHNGPSAPLTVRLSDPWSDFLRVADKSADPDAPPRSPSALPLLDDMKGILHWD
jgi:hypothetical protein